MKSLYGLFPVVISALIFFSCAKPTDPESLQKGSGGYEIVGRIQTPGYAQDVIVNDTLAYVAQGEGGLVIISIANPASPVILSTCKEGVRGYSTKIARKDTTVYVASGDFGVNVVNVADPLLPFATASNLSMKPARAILVFGTYLFTAVSELGVKIAELSYPTQPEVRGGMATNGYARGICFTPDSSFLLVACGEMGMSIHDIRNMRDGWGDYRLVGWTDTPGYAEDIVTIGNLPLAALACGNAGVYTVDFSDTNAVHVAGSIGTGGYARGMIYRNGRLYVTTQTNGLQIISVQNPEAPTLIGEIPTSYAIGVTLDDHYVYIADRNEGLIVVKIPAGV